MRTLGALVLLVGLAGIVTAQTPVNTTNGYRHFDGHSWLLSKVRDKAGNLYLCYTDQFQPPQNDIAIAMSGDGGKTWILKWQVGFATISSIDLGNRAPVMAIDSKENLHLAWCHVGKDDNSWSTSYRRYDLTTKTWSKEVSLSVPGRRQRFNCIAVDSNDQVWILRNTGFWDGFLHRSAKPSASDDTFVNFSPSFPTTCALERPHLIVDALDRLHISHYNYRGSHSNYHYWIDPAATSPQWSTHFNLGTPNSGGDFNTAMAADLNGNVYVVYVVEMPGVASGPDPYLALRKWDGMTQTWSSELKFYTTQRANLTENNIVNGCDFIAAACDESTGEFYFTYRDFDTGDWLLARWRDGDPKPTTYAKLLDTGKLPTNALNYFAYPQLRGTVTPVFNRAAHGLDLTYTVGHETGTTPKYTLFFDHFGIGSLSSRGSPRIGTTYPMDLASLSEPGMGYVVAVSSTGIGSVLQIDARRYVPLIPDPFFFVAVGNLLPTVFNDFHGLLGAAGTAQAKLVIPNAGALVGTSVHAAFVTYAGSAIGVISNPHSFKIVK